MDWSFPKQIICSTPSTLGNGLTYMVFVSVSLQALSLLDTIKETVFVPVELNWILLMSFEVDVWLFWS